MNVAPSHDSDAVRSAVQAVLKQADDAWSTQEAAQLVAALQAVNHQLETLPPEAAPSAAQDPSAAVSAPADADAFARERALLWLWRGRLLAAADQPQAVVQGLQSLDQAIARLSSPALQQPTENPEQSLAPGLVVAWMNRGSGLFRLGSREALAEGVRSYEQAIALMERAPHAEPTTLGAAWMNRGAGLLHLADEAPGQATNDSAEKIAALAARLNDAAQALEKAVAVLEPVAADQPSARHNLASTWANLGMLRARRGDAAGAVEAHRQSVETFRPLTADGDETDTLELAARLFNLSQAAGLAQDTELALAAGRESLVLASPFSRTDPQALQLDLRIRHALCVALGALLKPDFARGPAPHPTPDQSARIDAARELVDGGLALLREQTSPAPGATAAGARLYEFGEWLHRTWRPLGLGAFLLEHLDTDPTRARIAAASVQQARQAVMQRGFADVAYGGIDGMLDMLRSLRPVEERLQASNG